MVRPSLQDETVRSPVHITEVIKDVCGGKANNPTSSSQNIFSPGNIFIYRPSYSVNLHTYTHMQYTQFEAIFYGKVFVLLPVVVVAAVVFNPKAREDTPPRCSCILPLL